MLHPHSLLWHYLWVGPNVLQSVLVVLLWRRGLHKQFPAFIAYLVYGAFEQFTLWTMDVLPESWVGGPAWWHAFFVGSAIEDATKLALIWTLFTRLVGQRPSLIKSGTRKIVGTGVSVVALAMFATDRAQIGRRVLYVFRAQVFEMASYIVLCGLIVFLFVFAAYYGLTWGRRHLGIALGVGIIWCEHMATWALSANFLLRENGYFLDFLNGATYHACVALWFYYLLSPTPTGAALAHNEISRKAEDNPAAWHRGQKLQPAWFLARSKS
jgi:hypothetical protein